ncbi:hypothetical protein [Amycolatopsis sp. MEPSY49]|uniref:hypothetical protein n=1 Tax=Amycolatopsis sp. MEPSY49 TaxID=3151600 RepID=UPI003EF98E7D
MVRADEPSKWAVEQFGDAALDVATYVVKGLVRGQRSARAVQLAARAEGADDNYAYGSMWNARYKMVVDLFELADLPGFEIIKPKGASYRLAVVNGRVLIPFRHSDSLAKPINQAKLGSLIPRRLSRESGVLPENTLFDELGDLQAAAESEGESPSVGEVAAEARSLGLTVVYIGYVANPDSDEILAAWWGTPVSLEDDGSMVWFPERLDLSRAVEDSAGAASAGLHVAGSSVSTPGFAHGEEPHLAMDSRLRKDESPTSEVETDIPDLAAEDDE